MAKQVKLLDGTKVDIDAVIDEIKNQIGYEEWKESIENLKGFDLWPFDDDGDEFLTAFDEMRNNANIICDAALATIAMVERAFIGVAELENPQKHAIVREILDDAIKLPFYAEWADGPIIDLLISFAVRLMKRTIGEGRVEHKFNEGRMQTLAITTVGPVELDKGIRDRQAKIDKKRQEFDEFHGE